MQADFLLDYEAINAGKPHKIYLMARFVSGPAFETTDRRPLNLSLVIDRSGSMGGAKIDYTRQAAQFLVQNLSVHDTLSVVLYNDHVETLLMPEKVQRKDVINQRISGIKAKGTTNLSGGWLEGCNLVEQNLDEKKVNRVILMSDGLANRGITDSDKLVLMARQKFDANISTTTMGLGNDFNEDLLMEMANAGGGAFYFIESPEVTPLIFQEELKGLLSVVGQNLMISIIPGENVTIGEQLNAYAMQSDGVQNHYRMGDVFGDELKALVVPLHVDAVREPGTKQLATIRFEYDEIVESGTQHHLIELPVMITVKSREEDVVLSNMEVQQSVLLLNAAQARRTAVKAADEGLFETAAESLRKAANAIESSRITDPKLQEERNALIKQATQMEQGASKYGEYSRKTMSTQAFYTMTSRHDATMMLRIREEARKRASNGSDKEKETGENPQEASSVQANDIQITKQDGIPPTHVTWNDRRFELLGDLIRIGRSKHNEIVISASGVSRFHCQVRRIGGHLLLEDLGSTNGTMMHGKLLEEPLVLSVGDVAYLCDEKLVFHDGSPS